VAGTAGTLLVLDDLHWASADALALLGTLVHAAAESRLRVVGAYRDTEVGPADPFSVLLADLASAGWARQHLVGPLARDEAAHLLTALLREAGVRAKSALRERVLQRAGGVPFFLVSCVQGLQGAPGRGGDAPPVPWTVAQGVRQRVAALPGPAREVLAVAAVTGRVVPRAVLAASVAQPEGTLARALQDLCTARLVVEAGAHAYQCAHDVIREVVEADLGTAQRALLHAAIARALQQGPGTPLVEEIAHHYAQTEEHARAAEWLEKAGNQADTGFATTTALEHYARARQILALGGAPPEQLARLDERLGHLHVLRGEASQARDALARARRQATTPVHRARLWRREGELWGQQQEYARQLEALAAAEAEGGGDGPGGVLPLALRVMLELDRADAHFCQGQPEAGTRAIQRAHAALTTDTSGDAAEDAPEPALPAAAGGSSPRGDGPLYGELALSRAACWFTLGWLGVVHGEMPIPAEECLRRALSAAERSGDRYTACYCWGNLADLAWARGQLAQAQDNYERFGASALQGGYQICLGWAWNGQGYVALDRGDLAQAADCFGRALAIFEGAGYRGGAVAARGNLGAVACERGAYAAAVQWCRGARRLAQEVGASDLAAHSALIEAQAVLRAGSSRLRCGAATTLLHEARTRVVRPAYGRLAVRLRLLAAELSLQQGTLREAETAAEDVVRVARADRIRLVEAQGRRAQGQCALLRGDPAQAETHLRAALALFDEMDAALEGARTRRALAEALIAGHSEGGMPQEGHTLLAQAQAQFATSGAALDLAKAEHLAAVWAAHHGTGHR
jgi:tetratricopeptide (TPR) repeat protein